MSELQPISVYVVDDHRMFSDAIEILLRDEPAIRLQGRANDAEAALIDLADECADVVLMDIDLPGIDGIEATRRLKDVCRDVQVVVITAFQTQDTIARAIEAGASGYMPKTRAADELVDTIRLAAAGEAILPSEEIAPVLARLNESRRIKNREELLLDKLTSREIEILQSYAEGRSAQEVGQALFISVGTVQSHTKNILAKLDVHSKLEAVLLALRHGLIKLPTT